MPDSSAALAATSPSSIPSLADCRRAFDLDGYVLFRDAVPRAPLAALARDLESKWRADVASGAMFDGGGNLSGHLNCFPGASSRFVYTALEALGIFDVVAALSPEKVRKPNVGCNLNLPGSHAQNVHIDGYRAQPFLVVNVAVIDTDLTNGAMEITSRTHQRDYKYWEIILQRGQRRRVTMRQGDALLRTSTLWHRGMPNHSSSPRPMLAFTWENGGSLEQDPYAAHGGNITFLPNRYNTDWKGRLIERAFVAAPRLGSAYHAARSLLE
jgi:Phytanoyl-CoA dioxygenase (PhyH)